MREAEKVVSEYAAWMEGAEEAMGSSTEFIATVHKKNGRLGAAVKFDDGMTKISEIQENQAIYDWNRRDGAEDQIKVGDCIMKVNNFEAQSEQTCKDNVGTDPVVLHIDKECEAMMKTTTTTLTMRIRSADEDPEDADAMDEVKRNKEQTREIHKKLEALDDTKLAYSSLLGKTLEKAVGAHL